LPFDFLQKKFFKNQYERALFGADTAAQLKRTIFAGSAKGTWLIDADCESKVIRKGNIEDSPG
jgi:hypothetical protein